jgi:exodeoxyribonuclease V beta subunit
MSHRHESATSPLEPFDANLFPLENGIHLLEASAGTGKTFALAHLVLRLVGESGRNLRELLVVTFTEAAAGELRDRIGRRLQAALSGLEALETKGASWVAGDQVLRDWLVAMGAGADPDHPLGLCHRPCDGSAALRARLLLALEELDAADITTIHGFCHRSLQRLALEAARPPGLQLETDGGTLLEQVVHDYWQQQVLPLPAPLVAGLARQQVRPETLLKLLRQLDGDPALQLAPLPEGCSPQQALPDWLPAHWQLLWQTFVAQWQERGRALQQDLQAIADQWRQAGYSSTGDYVPKPRTRRCDLVDAFITGAAGEAGGHPSGSTPAPASYGEVLEQKPLTDYFHPGPFSQMARKVEGDSRAITLPQRPLMEAVAALVDGPAELVLLHACHWGRAELRRRRERAGTAGFSQLLEDLDPGTEAAAATPLLQGLGERYAVALIDEFQDTDPIQWRILRHTFGHGRHQLVMVGDPKQAIYRFRGGDLATYQAAAAMADRRYALNENRRSTPELIDAFNRLMTGPGLARSRLPVATVQARSRRRGPADAPLELLWLGGDRPAGEPALSATALERELADRLAAYVVELLERGALLAEDERERQLSCDDLCLLVLNHRQAERLRQALERCGIASRLVSRADVFATPAATMLQRLLDALADPAGGRRLRLLAATPLLGWSAARIAAAGAEHWSELAGRLDQLNRRLPRLGLPGVLAELMGSEGLARVSLGGRLMADLQQVAALVEEHRHAEGLGAAAAGDWLRRLRLEPDRDPPEEHQTHSDRVDGAVSVVTVHRSKGLEFPVVICPYLWQAASKQRSGPGGPGARWLPDPTALPELDLHLNTDWGTGHVARRQARAAEEAERERLAYVAATRACHLLVLAWGPADGHGCAPLFPWLFPQLPLPGLDDDPFRDRADAEWRELLEQGIAAEQLPLRLVELPEAGTRRLAPTVAAAAAPLVRGPVPNRRLDSGWGRSSYTSWTHASGGAPPPLASDDGRDTDGLSSDALDAEALAAYDPAADERAVATAAGIAQAAAGSWSEQGPLTGFARGAAAGDCLHRILEQIDYRSALGAAANRAVVEKELRRAGLEDHPLEPLLAGLELTRVTPFGGALGPTRLADLDAGNRLNELSFDLSLDHARARGLAAAFSDHPGGAFGPAYAARLAQLPVDSRGFLTGSIDLIFTAPASDDPPGAAARWWVADWKSNWLGARDGEGRPLACGPRHYGPEAMAQLMAANHYPLQAHLYLVALHRYLRWRLPGYRPEAHLGGYLYVFLRGTPGALEPPRPPDSVPGMFLERPPLGRLLALDRALGSGRVTPLEAAPAQEASP